MVKSQVAGPQQDVEHLLLGDGVADLWSPEINSVPKGLPIVSGCNPLPDPADATSSNAWTDSFQNIQCYDSLKVQAIIHEIDGKTHDGRSSAPVPALFGMNFQAVSVGEKLVEANPPTNPNFSQTGGYLDPLATPSASLQQEIEYVDRSIGSMVSELSKQGLLSSTLIALICLASGRSLRATGRWVSMDTNSVVTRWISSTPPSSAPWSRFW